MLKVKFLTEKGHRSYFNLRGGGGFFVTIKNNFIGYSKRPQKYTNIFFTFSDLAINQALDIKKPNNYNYNCNQYSCYVFNVQRWITGSF